MVLNGSLGSPATEQVSTHARAVLLRQGLASLLPLPSVARCSGACRQRLASLRPDSVLRFSHMQVQFSVVHDRWQLLSTTNTTLVRSVVEATQRLWCARTRAQLPYGGVTRCHLFVARHRRWRHRTRPRR